MSQVVESRVFTDREFRDAMGGFASGVTVITTMHEEAPVGFTCQSFYSVSVDPPMVSFSVGRASRSLEALRATGHLVINFLGADHQHLSGQFARSGTDKWAGVEWEPSEVNNAPTITGTSGWVAGQISQEIEAGDHLIFLVDVHGFDSVPEQDPLLFYRGKYHGLASHE